MMLRLDSLLAGALAGGLVYGLAAAIDHRPEDSDAATAAATPPVAPTALAAAPQDDAPLERMRLARLEERLGLLEVRLDRLAELPPSATALSPTAPDDSLATVATDDRQRALVLAVLEDQRSREAEERRAELRARELARGEERADRLAEGLGLLGAERDALVAVFSEQSEARLDLVERLRELEPADRDAREQLREELSSLREQEDRELELRLGVETASRIAEWEAENRPRGPLGAGPRVGFGRGRD